MRILYDAMPLLMRSAGVKHYHHMLLRTLIPQVAPHQIGLFRSWILSPPTGRAFPTIRLTARSGVSALWWLPTIQVGGWRNWRPGTHNSFM